MPLLRGPDMPEYNVSVDQLRVGVFVRLNLKWIDHPFLFNSFKITKPEQITALKDLAISHVICVPEKSDVLPLSLQQIVHSEKKAEPSPARTAQPVKMQRNASESQELWNLKRERIERLKARRLKNEQCEKQFQKSLDTVKSVMRKMETGSQESFEEADLLMRNLVETLMPEKEAAVQIMNTEFGKENVFYHSLNVAVLAMMLGREHGLGADELRELGIGALFHDIGKSRIPKSILQKTAPLTRAELKFLQLHPKYGVDMLSKIEKFPRKSIQVVQQHHERNDGQGYPLGLKGEQISLFAKITSIINVYDNHCNRLNSEDSLTPYEALSRMFTLQKEMFDKELLAIFIECLGVYPPGTIVRLSNGSVGMVISVNPKNPLHPSILLYDHEIPKKEALIFDMEDDPNLTIEVSIRPSQLPPEIFNYLSPRTRVTYYVATYEDRVDKAPTSIR
jgi:putative nucleotidyltransferase with HDIG domain